MAALTGTVLKYNIYKYSSFSSNYYPENILVNKPQDQASRWSPESNSPPQFLLLKLVRPAIVESITFGKYEKSHVCNVKKFKVFGAMNEEENMIELLESGLKNDDVAETFSLQHTIDGSKFPCQFISIVPFQSWGASFNFCIWFVELRGSDDPRVVKPSLDWFNTYREREVLRLCLKHFRHRNFVDIYQMLQERTGVTLEHPTLADLHSQLVMKGDFESSERLVESAVEEGLFDSFIRQQNYKPTWQAIEPVQDGPFGASHRPGMRGGHQMCMDVQAECIYLFGGWDSREELADLWVYNIPCNRWTLLSDNTEEQGGPCGRSCHKICLDTVNRQMFTLGRFIDSDKRTPENMKSDFYMYDIEDDKWTLITDDTLAMGGPCLLYEHHMVVDSDQHTIYVFNGRQITGAGSANVFSGLYSYHIPTNTWKRLRNNQSDPVPVAGQAVIFHPVQRCLYIFSGERFHDSSNDIWLYYVDTDVVKLISDGASKVPSRVPSSFTQRATLDLELNEIYLLAGLHKDQDKQHHVHNSLWIYDIAKNKWSFIYSNEKQKEIYWNRTQCEPVPRYAHQLVYDHAHKVHYLFGGNPGNNNNSSPEMRLDDFWLLKLHRPTVAAVLQECRYMIRRQHFEELARTDPVRAVFYLQSSVCDVVDHANQQKKYEFERLPCVLFENYTENDAKTDCDMSTDDSFAQRTRVFDRLAAFFPAHMTQPRCNISDLVKLNADPV